MSESAEDLLPADPVLGEVDRYGCLSLGLGGCEVAKGSVRPGGVVPQVFGQYLAQVTLVDDQQSVEKFTAQGADDPFADRVRLGACGGLGRILMPAAVNTASKELVNWPHDP